MLDFLLNLDQSIFLFFNGIHSDFWDRAMFMFSGRFIWVPMYIAFYIAFFKGFQWKVAVVWILAIGLTILIADQLCATVIRPFFERMRPSNPENPLSEFAHVVKDYRGGRYGFPSCHAANSFALATIMALIWRGTRLKWFIFIWAFINSYSRLYLGVHYPGDLFVGGIIGSLVAVIMFIIGRAVVWSIMKGDMVKARPQRYVLRINDYVFNYRSIDGSVAIGITTVIVILLIAVD
ncbi:MAG: phosphatase PAP2 family protein [Muribaculaceae bacterium]|nr:phosphatase PAP2 family protein [Muribaculaceae bacterium]